MTSRGEGVCEGAEEAEVGFVGRVLEEELGVNRLGGAGEGDVGAAGGQGAGEADGREVGIGGGWEGI